jgi:hypothetical protein
MTEAAQNDVHRPHDRETLRAAAIELRARGLTPHDIAVALRLPVGAVRSLLGLQAISGGAL